MNDLPTWICPDVFPTGGTVRTITRGRPEDDDLPKLAARNDNRIGRQTEEIAPHLPVPGTRMRRAYDVLLKIGPTNNSTFAKKCRLDPSQSSTLLGQLRARQIAVSSGPRGRTIWRAVKI